MKSLHGPYKRKSYITGLRDCNSQLLLHDSTSSSPCMASRTQRSPLSRNRTLNLKITSWCKQKVYLDQEMALNYGCQGKQIKIQKVQWNLNFWQTSNCCLYFLVFLFTIHLKFIFNWVSCVLLGNHTSHPLKVQAQ
jgi:hypothetical protein